MIIKSNSTRLIITLTLLLIIPFVQKQWFNLYLFDVKGISFYSILYLLSGIICPSLIYLNSLNSFTYYNFNNYRINNKKKIKGKTLLFLVVINLFFLSSLIVNYFYLNIDLIVNLFLEGNKLNQTSLFHSSFYILIVSILLILKKTRFFFKKLILVNFMSISFFIWYSQINNISVDDQFHIYRNLGIDDMNLINVFILISLEIFYFIWSFLSYKTNLSDWIVRRPQKGDLHPLFNIFIFYFFIFIYYSILT